MPPTVHQLLAVDVSREFRPVEEQLPQAPATSTAPFARMAVQAGVQSTRPSDPALPEDLELPMEIPYSKKLSRITEADSVSSDSTTEWLPCAPSTVSRSSHVSSYSSEEFDVRSRPLNGTALGKPCKAPSCFPRLTVPSFVTAAGARLKKGLHPQSHREASKEASTLETAGVRQKNKSQALLCKEASKEASVAQRERPSSTRASPSPRRVPIVAIDDTTCVPADVVLSLLNAANVKKNEGQHKIVSAPKPRLVPMAAWTDIGQD